MAPRRRGKWTAKSNRVTQPIRSARIGPPPNSTPLQPLPHSPFLTLKVNIKCLVIERGYPLESIPYTSPHLLLNETASGQRTLQKLQTQQEPPKRIVQQRLSNIEPNLVAFSGTGANQSILPDRQAATYTEALGMSNSFQDVGGVGAALRDVVNDLFLIQSQVDDFHSDHQQNLNAKVDDLVESLSNVQVLTSKEQSPGNPIHEVLIAPDIIDYVDDGRNPDIYTRDFVELVQRGNAVLNGKQKAFRDFSTILADKIRTAIPDLQGEVDMIMRKAGIENAGKNGPLGQNGGP